MTILKLLTAAAVLVATSAVAQAQQGMGGMGMGGMGGRSPGSGPVALHCNDDAAKHCTGLSHGGGAVRDCLEQNIAKVSDACRSALKSTGRHR